MSYPPRRAVMHTRARPFLARWWLRAGWFPGWVIPSGEWTMVVMEGPDSDVPPLLSALSRPIPRWLGPTLQWAQRDNTLVLTGSAPIAPREAQWAAWRAGEGLTHLPQLPALRETRLVGIAGGLDAERRQQMMWHLRAACARPHMMCEEAAERLFSALELPGVGFLVEDAPLVPLVADERIETRRSAVQWAAEAWDTADVVE